LSLFRRRLWGDRITLIFVAIATAGVVYLYQTRGGDLRLYILTGWSLFVAWLIGYSELRIGRKQLRRGRDAMFLGLAAFVGEETVGSDGDRERGWTGAAAGALAFEPHGIRWVPKLSDGPEELSFAWTEVFSWRLVGVIPFVWRASGYLVLSIYGGRELVFHIHGLRSWRHAVREAAIVGPTLIPRGHTTTEPREQPAALAWVPPPPPEPEPEPQEIGVEPVKPKGPAYEPVIGLECHVELATNSKMFCGCPTRFGTAPNTQVCAVCSGQPGSLPVPNRRAIEQTLRIALALGSTVAPQSIFHRKNYFYPDMPKNYQISQYDIPMSSGGSLDFDVDGKQHSTRIHRVHLEEDTGKTIHAGEGGRIGAADHASIDYNRAGIPLVEIVSEADIRTSEEARSYLSELRTLLLSLGVSDVRMEEGSLRCDANISLRATGTTEFGVKVEVKNMNSLRSVQRALEFEIERQTFLLEAGEEIVQETRHFDEESGKTIGGRSKEYSADYRYFPDPDLVPIAPSPEWLSDIRGTLPELPSRRRGRFISEFGLAQADARSLVASPGLADEFQKAVQAYGGSPQSVSRWYLGELAQLANERGVEPHEVGVSPDRVAELQKLVDEGTISISMAKGEVLRKVAETGKSPRDIVAEESLSQISDTSELGALVDEVIQANGPLVEQIRGGKTGAINALVGDVMKRTKGQANAQVVLQLLNERLGA
jgi:aspartyl-tRNA(Asn)/glutamyl-tRNA(Gln) amidotransferase subunit B